MGWQKIDDQFGISRKVTRIPRRYRLAAVGLWELASNYASRSETDGVLHGVELEEVLATDALVHQLVTVGLWHQLGHDCERCVQPPSDGVVIHDYLEYNPSRAQLEAKRASDRKRKGIQRDSARIPDGLREDSVSPSPVPVPMTDMTNDTQVSHVGDVAPKLTDREKSQARVAGITNLPAVLEALTACCGPMAPAAGILLAQAICARSRGPVKRVDGYVLTAVEKSPDDVRWEFERLDLGAIA